MSSAGLYYVRKTQNIKHLQNFWQLGEQQWEYNLSKEPKTMFQLWINFGLDGDTHFNVLDPGLLLLLLKVSQSVFLPVKRSKQRMGVWLAWISNSIDVGMNKQHEE